MSSGDDPDIGGVAIVDVSVAELDGEADCGFLIYRVDGEADPDDAPSLDDDAANPPLPDGAELVGVGSLPPAGTHVRHVTVEAFLPGGRVGEDDPIDLTLVVATCTRTGVEVELDLDLGLCQPGDEGPHIDPSTAFRRLW